MTRDELIERMARAAYDVEWGHGAYDSDKTSPFERETHRLHIEAAVRALPGLADVIDGKAVIVPVEARPLNWQETYRDRGDGSSELSGWEAEGFGEWYCIEQYFGTDSYGWQVKYSMDVIGDYDDPDTAKAAAQRDYANKALSALIEARPK